MATTYSTTTGTKRRPSQNQDNFLEALRDLGKNVFSEAKTQAKKVVFDDIPQEFGLSSSGTIKPNESVSFEQLQKIESDAQMRAEQASQRRFEQMRQEEHALLARHESMAKEEIKSIRQEIASLAKSAGELIKEVEIAAFQAPVNPGIYHRNFFSQLRSFLVTMRKRIQDSKEWLSTTNSRASRKGYYWGQVGKSGTKYMLSSERYMVTSTG